MKKIYLLISIILLTFILFIIVLFKERNYEITYQINDYQIKEQYLKNEGYYFFINYEDTTYPLFINQKYTRKRKHLSNIESLPKESEICLKVSIFNNNYYTCSNNKELVTINNLSKEFQTKYNLISNNKLLKTYQNIKLYNNKQNIFIWNYKGFYNLQNEKNINIFKKDNYQNELTYQTNKYLIIPDYDSNYYFTKIYLYNIKKEELKSITFNYEISYDAFYLGEKDNKVYLIDRKNNNEYELNINKNTLKLISKDDEGIYYQNNKWQKASLTTIINNNLIFSDNSQYNFTLTDNKLYLNIKDYQILINTNVKSIIKINNDTVYYLINDELYAYKYLDNNYLILKYPELNFNYHNQIFIIN